VTHQRDRAWAQVTGLSSAAVSAVAAVVLFVLAYAGPNRSITEVDFTRSRVFVVRLIGAVFLLVLTLSCLLQAGLHLPQRAALRSGMSAPAVLDLVVIVGVVVEVALVLSVGFRDEPDQNLVILAGGAAIVLTAFVRFLMISSTGIHELVIRRHEHRSDESELPQPPTARTRSGGMRPEPSAATLALVADVPEREISSTSRPVLSPVRRSALVRPGFALLGLGAATLLAGCYRAAVELSHGRIRPLVPVAVHAPFAAELLLLIAAVLLVAAVLLLAASRQRVHT
jgi:hypothetical protein